MNYEALACRIEVASLNDLPDVRAAYEHARAMQRERSAIVWPEFADDAILREIEDQRLFLVVISDILAGVFSVAYDDSAGPALATALSREHVRAP